MRLLCKIGFLTVCVIAAVFSAAVAQNAYLATVNYNTLSVNSIGNIPGVPASAFDNFENITFDQNNQRYLFQSSATGNSPNRLYTIDAVSGAVVYNPAIPAGNIGGYVYGMQYDNASDTLYALYADVNWVFYFAWITPSTGAVHIIKSIPYSWQYSQTTFDIKDHLYIVTNATNLLVINAATGALLYNSTFPPTSGIINIMYDNVTARLYGISPSNTIGYNLFDSISLATGAHHAIANLPSYIAFPEIYAFGIDERAGKYIFVGEDTRNPSCTTDSLYVLDIKTGAILSRSAYHYSPVTIQSNKFLMNYSFDNQRGILYAINWVPPNSTPGISVSASSTTICAGQPDTFRAATVNAGTLPAFQWQINGNNVGTNDSVYAAASLSAGDTVRCIMTFFSFCAIDGYDTSNKVGVPVNATPASSVGISASETNICSGDTVLFTASPVNGGLSPSYQWRINGVSTTTNKSTFSSASLRDGDMVDCIMTGTLECSLPAASNIITIVEKPGPVVYAGRDTVISLGKSIQLDPSITGAVASYLWTPATALNNPGIARPVARPLTTTTYQLTVTANNGCRASGKITVSVYSPLHMPNAFTPNGDGKNDVFRIPPVLGEKINSFSVFNRWGQVVFKTTNSAEGWNGMINNQPQPTGTYIWNIEYVDLITGKVIAAHGTVMLIR